MCSFFHWLVQNINEDRGEQILFLARDGYLLKEQYEYFVNINKINLPKSVYFPASRRLTCVAAIESKEDLKDVISYYYRGSFHDFLWKRFGVKIQENDRNRNCNILLPQDVEIVCDWVKNTNFKLKKR